MYLQLNGDGNYLKTPFLTYDKIVMDVYIYHPPNIDYSYMIDTTTRSNGYLRYVKSSTSPQGNFTLQGHSVNIRTMITATITAKTAELFFSTRADGIYAVKSDIYNIKLYNGGTLVAHYDMNTGTVQDQSGNGNHATLTGGTWAADTPTGTDVSYTYPTKQSLYNVVASSFATEQNIYADKSYSYPTQQTLYTDFVSFSANFPVKIVISDDKSYSYPLKQAITKNVSAAFPMKQAIYKAEVVEVNTKQVIYKDTVTSNQLKQVITALRSYDNPFLIKVFDPDKTVIGEIYLKGEREITIKLHAEIITERLQGKRELNVKLEGVIS